MRVFATLAVLASGFVLGPVPAATATWGPPTDPIRPDEQSVLGSVAINSRVWRRGDVITATFTNSGRVPSAYPNWSGLPYPDYPWNNTLARTVDCAPPAYACAAAATGAFVAWKPPLGPLWSPTTIGIHESDSLPEDPVNLFYFRYPDAFWVGGTVPDPSATIYWHRAERTIRTVGGDSLADVATLAGDQSDAYKQRIVAANPSVDFSQSCGLCIGGKGVVGSRDVTLPAVTGQRTGWSPDGSIPLPNGDWEVVAVDGTPNPVESHEYTPTPSQVHVDGDNVLDVNFTSQLNNLKIDAVRFPSTAPEPGTPFEVQVDVRNSGSGALTNIQGAGPGFGLQPAMFPFDGSAAIAVLGGLPIATLAPGATQTVRYQVTASVPGRLSVRPKYSADTRTSAVLRSWGVTGGAIVSTGALASTRVGSKILLLETFDIDPIQIGEDVVAGLRVYNVGDEPVTNVTVDQLDLGGSAALHIDSGPTPATVLSIAGNGGSKFIRWGLTGVKAGVPTITYSVRATSPRGTEHETKSQVVRVGSPLEVSVTAPDTVGMDETFEVRVQAHNAGDTTMSDVTPLDPIDLAITGHTPVGDVVKVDPTTAPAPVTLTGGASHDFVYHYKATAPGTFRLSATVNATADGANISAGSHLDMEVAAGISVVFDDPPGVFAVGKARPVKLKVRNTSSTDKVVGIAPNAPTITGDGSATTGDADPETLELEPHGEAVFTIPLSLSADGEHDVSWTVSGTNETTSETLTSRPAKFTAHVFEGALEVNDNGDEADADDADALCDTRNDDDKSTVECTLRAAIEASNARQAAGEGEQSIAFDIPGDGEPAVVVGAALPDVEGTTTIDGTTQPGGRRPKVSPAEGSSSADGLVLTGQASTLKGLALTGFSRGVVLKGSGRHNVLASDIFDNKRAGVEIESDANAVGAGDARAGCANECNMLSGNGHPDYSAGGAFAGPEADVVVASGAGNRIAGNAIDVDRDFTPTVSQDSGKASDGVSVPGGTGTVVGPGNVISGRFGVVAGAPVHVRGNLIGILPSGAPAVQAHNSVYPDKGTVGVLALSSGVVVGGPAQEDGNIVSGWGDLALANDSTTHLFTSHGAGVLVDAAGVVVQSNKIGTDRSGERSVPNLWGVKVGAITPVDGGSESVRNGGLTNGPAGTAIEDNLVSGNSSRPGISNSVDTSVRIVGNRVGTNAAGTNALPNRFGIVSLGTVGGERAAGASGCESPCNLVSGNTEDGITADRVLGNFIGTDIAGSAAVPNGGVGVKPHIGAEVGGPSGATIGTCDRACNLIAFNKLGIETRGAGAARIRGNVVRSNRDAGVTLGRNAETSGPGSTIGGADTADGNLIEHNGGHGVLAGWPGEAGEPATISHNVIASNGGAGVLVTAVASRIEVTANRISGNAELGIDLSASGLAGDSSAPGDGPGYAGAGPDGPNHLVQSPTTVVATTSDGTLHVLLEAMSGIPRVDIYASRSCDPSGYGEGEFDLGHVNGIAVGRTRVGAPAPPDGAGFITLTATSSDGSTSEFSRCAEIRPSTTLSGQANAGTVEIPVESNDMVPVGDQALVGPGTHHPEVVTVVGHGSLLLGAPLAFEHGVGELVVDLGAPPETSITKAPANPSPSGTAAFEFNSDVPDAAFECSVDGSAPAPCTSPHQVAIADGPHAFTVRALLQDGRFDPTPAAASWLAGPGYTITGLRPDESHRRVHPSQDVHIKLKLAGPDGSLVSDAEARSFVGDPCGATVTFTGGTPKRSCFEYSKGSNTFHLNLKMPRQPGTYAIVVSFIRNGSVIATKTVQIVVAK